MTATHILNCDIWSVLLGGSEACIISNRSYWSVISEKNANTDTSETSYIRIQIGAWIWKNQQLMKGIMKRHLGSERSNKLSFEKVV